jgi:hypothetical protein
MQQFSYNHQTIGFNNMWLTNARRSELQVQDRDLRELFNEDDFFALFSRQFSIDRHPLINYPKLWDDFPFPEIM